MKYIKLFIRWLLGVLGIDSRLTALNLPSIDGYPNHEEPMAKIVLNPITGSYLSVTAFNNAMQQIEDTFNNNVLWRDGFVSEPNTMDNDFDMGGFSVLNAVYDFNTLTIEALSFVQNGADVVDESATRDLGAHATPPTTRQDGVTSLVEGDFYYNTSTEFSYTYDGAGFNILTATAASTAVSTSISDAGEHYSAIEVETAFQDIATPNVVGKGAHIIGFNDINSSFANAENTNLALTRSGVITDSLQGEQIKLSRSYSYDTLSASSSFEETITVSGLSAGIVEATLGLSITFSNFAYAFVLDHNNRIWGFVCNPTYTGAVTLPATPSTGDVVLRVTSNTGGASTGTAQVSVSQRTVK